MKGLPAPFIGASYSTVSMNLGGGVVALSSIPHRLLHGITETLKAERHLKYD